MSKSRNDVVMIDLDKPRALKFTYSGLKKLSAVTGKTIAEIEQGVATIDYDLIEEMVHVGLNDDSVTIHDIPAMIDQAPHMGHILEQLNLAWRVAWGVPTDGGDNAGN